jgi:hypothetical protein
LRNLLILPIAIAAACAPAPVVSNNPEILAEADFQTHVAELRGTPAIPLPTPTGSLPRGLRWQSISLYGPVGPFQPFEMEYPEGWESTGGENETSILLNFGEIKFLLFAGKPYNEDKENDPDFVPFEIIFQCFHEAITQNAESVEVHHTPHIEVEWIAYISSRGNCVADGIRAPGILALWAYEGGGYALIDEGSRHQADGIFNAMLDTFRFMD